MDFPTGTQYRVILADPPWKFQVRRGLSGLAADQYPCMGIAEIAALPVREVGASDCALFMWVPAPLLAEGKHVPIFKAWGFRVVTIALVWNKTWPNGRPYSGLGFYTRSGAEMCVLGIRGKRPRRPEATNVLQVITAPRVARHSTKPEAAYGRIEALYDGPYLELFARQRRASWDAWGNELDTPAENGTIGTETRRPGVIIGQ